MWHENWNIFLEKPQTCLEVWSKRRLIFLKVQHFGVIVYFEYFEYYNLIFSNVMPFSIFILYRLSYLQQRMGVFQWYRKKWGYHVIQWLLCQINLSKTFLWIICAAKLKLFIFPLWYREKCLYKADKSNEEQKLWSNPENFINQRLKQSHKSALN